MLLAQISSGENFFRFLVALGAFIIVIIATYYVSKWTAGYQRARMTGRNFEVVDSLRISTNKYLMLVRVGRERYVCVGVGKDELCMLGDFSREEVVLFDRETGAKSGREGLDFSGLIASFGSKSQAGEHHED